MQETCCLAQHAKRHPMSQIDLQVQGYQRIGGSFNHKNSCSIRHLSLISSCNLNVGVAKHRPQAVEGEIARYQQLKGSRARIQQKHAQLNFSTIALPSLGEVSMRVSYELENCRDSSDTCSGSATKRQELTLVRRGNSYRLPGRYLARR
jgi:hypothetical protein